MLPGMQQIQVYHCLGHNWLLWFQDTMAFKWLSSLSTLTPLTVVLVFMVFFPHTLTFKKEVLQ